MVFKGLINERNPSVHFFRLCPSVCVIGASGGVSVGVSVGGKWEDEE